MSFDPKNSDHKAKLYRALVAAAELVNETFDQFLQTPFDPPWNVGPNYRRNLQRGEYSAIRAGVLHDFLMRHHFAAARLEAPEIFPQSPERRWQEIVDERGIEGRLSIVPVKRSMGIVQWTSDIDAAEATLKLGQEFVLKLESEVRGYAIALQGVRNAWHPIPLNQERGLVAPVKTGNNVLPLGANDQPETLVESHDLGMHQFVVVAADARDIPVDVSKLVTCVHEKACLINTFTVRFVE